MTKLSNWRKHGAISASTIALAAALAFPAKASAQEANALTQTPASDQVEADTATEIVVTGSRIARSQESLSSPTQILGHEEIAESGLVGVDDLLLLDTANIGSVGGAQDLAGGGADDRATRSANLRGLGVESTLVLLNGRRIAHTDSYVNLVALTPTIAVDRVETVLDGASALYGSDAIAGVINVITNDHFDGVRLSAQYTDISRAPGYIVQGMIGGGTDRFHAVLSASYEYQDKLQGYERERTNFDNTSGLSQPGNFILRSRPETAGGGDVIIDNGINGPINYSQLYDQQVAATGSTAVQFADPYCTDASTGGIYAGSQAFPLGSCRFSYQQRNPVKPRARITLVHADATYDLGDDHELYFEGRYYQQGTERYGIGSFPITTGSLIVPASNPHNPFGVDATFVGRLLGNTAPDRIERVDLDAFGLVGGAKGPLPFGNNWKYDVSLGYSREDYVLHTSDTDLIAAQNALNGFGGPDCQIGPSGLPSPTEAPGQGNCVYFSPFGKDQSSNDPRTTYNTLTPFNRGQESEIRFAEAVVTGDLLELPGGSMGIALGTQVREESEDIFLDSGLVNGRFGFQGKSFPGNGARTIKSLFGELYLPVLHSLDVQLAGRYEDYGQFSTTDPKIGINFRPLDWLALRASYSTAFRAPDLGQAVSNTVTSGVGQTVDPLDPPDSFRDLIALINTNPKAREEFKKARWEGMTGRKFGPIKSIEAVLEYSSFESLHKEAADQLAEVTRMRLEFVDGVIRPAIPQGKLISEGIYLHQEQRELGKAYALQIAKRHRNADVVLADVDRYDVAMIQTPRKSTIPIVIHRDRPDLDKVLIAYQQKRPLVPDLIKRAEDDRTRAVRTDKPLPKDLAPAWLAVEAYRVAEQRRLFKEVRVQLARDAAGTEGAAQVVRWFSAELERLLRKEAGGRLQSAPRSNRRGNFAPSPKSLRGW